jgi:hypothetical protein
VGGRSPPHHTVPVRSRRAPGLRLPLVQTPLSEPTIANREADHGRSAANLAWSVDEPAIASSSRNASCCCRERGYRHESAPVIERLNIHRTRALTGWIRPVTLLRDFSTMRPPAHSAQTWNFRVFPRDLAGPRLQCSTSRAAVVPQPCVKGHDGRASVRRSKHASSQTASGKASHAEQLLSGPSPQLASPIGPHRNRSLLNPI